MRVFSDRIAIVTTAIGVGLLIVMMLTRVNPVEGSVVRPQFLHTPLGRPLATLVLIAGLPGWIGVMLTTPLGAPFQHRIAVLSELVLFQVLIYWLLGKMISIGWRKRRENNTQRGPIQGR
jgi:hypothetical protein